MNMKIFWITVAGALVMASLPVHAQAIDFSVESSGYYRNEISDTNGDGILAKQLEVDARGTFGRSAMWGLWELAPIGFADECGGYPNAGFVYVEESVVFRASNGDLLFIRLKPGTGFGCLNLATGEGHGSAQFTIVGGTGRFEGATGDLEDSGWVRVLVHGDYATDPNAVKFAAVTGKTWGVIYLDEP